MECIRISLLRKFHNLLLINNIYIIKSSDDHKPHPHLCNITGNCQAKKTKFRCITFLQLKYSAKFVNF